MKTPQQWLDLFTAQDTTYDRPTAEANIKAVQDEAFKAGYAQGHCDCATALEMADPALKASIEDRVRKRLEEP